MKGRDRLGEEALERSIQAALPGHETISCAQGPLRAALSGPGRDADAVVIAGCQLFGGGGTSLGAAALRTLGAAASLLGRNRVFGLVGVSACGPLTAADRWAARQLVQRCDLVLLSDADSALALAAAGAASPLRVASDPAWLGLASVSPGCGTGQTVLVVLDGESGPDVERELTAGLRTVTGHGMYVWLLPWGPSPADRRMAERLSSRLEGPGRVELLPPAEGLAGAAETMSEALVVVSLRYRGLHAAAAAGVPSVGVAVERRSESLAARLGQRCLEPSALGRSLLRAVLRAADSPGPSPAVVKEEVARAEAGLSLLRLVLERGDVDAAGLEGLPLAPQPWL